jgi:uncharacterized membrane protein YhaH (DUF805 family)
MISAATSTSFGAGFGILIVFYLIVLVLSLVAWAQILKKAGYNPWWVLIAFVPLVNFIMFFVFAFSEWPVLRMGRGGMSPPPPYGSAPPYGQYGSPPPPGNWQG